jgi:hypothetical protein
MEPFPENFADYALDEAVFKAIRPKTHALLRQGFSQDSGDETMIELPQRTSCSRNRCNSPQTALNRR